MNKEKVLEFMKKHKKELAISAVSIVGGCLIFMVVKKNSNEIVKDFMCPKKERARIEALNWKIGDMKYLWDERGWTNAIIDDVPLKDAGELGKEIMRMKNVDENTTFNAVIGIQIKN